MMDDSMMDGPQGTPLKFSAFHGRNVIFEEERLVAKSLYRYAQGLFMLNRPLDAGEKFNIDVHGSGILKLCVFDTHHLGSKWVRREKALPRGSIRFRITGSVHLRAEVPSSGDSIHIYSHKFENNDTWPRVLSLGTQVVFDIECGDIHVSIVDNRGKISVDTDCHSQTLNVIVTSQSSSVTLRHMNPFSLCSPKNAPLEPGRTYTLQVSGSDKVKDTGSYFKVCVAKCENVYNNEIDVIVFGNETCPELKGKSIAINANTSAIFHISVFDRGIRIHSASSRVTDCLYFHGMEYQKNDITLWFEIHKVSLRVWQKNSINGFSNRRPNSPLQLRGPYRRDNSPPIMPNEYHPPEIRDVCNEAFDQGSLCSDNHFYEQVDSYRSSSPQRVVQKSAVGVQSKVHRDVIAHCEEPYEKTVPLFQTNVKSLSLSSKCFAVDRRTKHRFATTDRTNARTGASHPPRHKKAQDRLRSQSVPSFARALSISPHDEQNRVTDSIEKCRKWLENWETDPKSSTGRCTPMTTVDDPSSEGSLSRTSSSHLREDVGNIVANNVHETLCKGRTNACKDTFPRGRFESPDETFVKHKINADGNKTFVRDRVDEHENTSSVWFSLDDSTSISPSVNHEIHIEALEKMRYRTSQGGTGLELNRRHTSWCSLPYSPEIVLQTQNMPDQLFCMEWNSEQTVPKSSEGFEFEPSKSTLLHDHLSNSETQSKVLAFSSDAAESQMLDKMPQSSKTSTPSLAGQDNMHGDAKGCVSSTLSKEFSHDDDEVKHSNDSDEDLTLLKRPEHNSVKYPSSFNALSRSPPNPEATYQTRRERRNIVESDVLNSLPQTASVAEIQVQRGRNNHPYQLLHVPLPTVKLRTFFRRSISSDDIEHNKLQSASLKRNLNISPNPSVRKKAQASKFQADDILEYVDDDQRPGIQAKPQNLRKCMSSPGNE